MPTDTSSSSPYPSPASYGHAAYAGDTSDLKRNLLIGAAALVLVVVAAVVLFVNMNPAPVSAPTAFVPYSGDGGAFTIDQPQAWNASALGSSSATPSSEQDSADSAGGVRFQSGTASVIVNTDSISTYVKRSVVGVVFDLFSKSTDTLQTMINNPTLEYHRQSRLDVSNTMSGYFEQFAQTWTGPLGTVAVSEFTANGGLAGRLHGYRASIMANRLYSVVCRCRESDWPALKPAFERMIKSLSSPDWHPTPSLPAYLKQNLPQPAPAPVNNGYTVYPTQPAVNGSAQQAPPAARPGWQADPAQTQQTQQAQPAAPVMQQWQSSRPEATGLGYSAAPTSAATTDQPSATPNASGTEPSSAGPAVSPAAQTAPAAQVPASSDQGQGNATQPAAGGVGPSSQ